ncbi:MAG: hypothetical protein NVS1B2_03160 [Vulcanimicrobiaceae bacterium]
MHVALPRAVGALRTTLAVAALALVTFASAPPAGAIVYGGQPDLALTTAMVVAGGGPEHFSSKKLFAAVTGSLAGPEAAKLTAQFGREDVADTFAIFDFAVADVVRIANQKHIALPAPAPAPDDAKALATALYAAGLTQTGVWDVGYMLERLISHPIHHTIMKDIDAKFGASKNGNFHMVLAQMMHDLAIAYRSAQR